MKTVQINISYYIFMETSGGSKGRAQGTHAPCPGPKFLHFHAVFRKNWPNNRLAPHLGLAPPPLENPGSATGNRSSIVFVTQFYYFINPGFPRGGRQHTIWPNFPENCMKMKKFWSGVTFSCTPVFVRPQM